MISHTLQIKWNCENIFVQGRWLKGFLQRVGSGNDWEIDHEFMKQLGKWMMHKSLRKLMNVFKSVGIRWRTRANSDTKPLNALDNVKLFQENHGFHQEAGTISLVGDAIACARVKPLIKASYPFWLLIMTPNPTGYEIFILQCHCMFKKWIEPQECTAMNKWIITHYNWEQ